MAKHIFVTGGVVSSLGKGIAAALLMATVHAFVRAYTLVESVPALANLIVFPMLFLGGTFFPVTGMPGWLQAIAKLLPLTFFSTALREVMTKDAGLGAIKWDILGMLAWGAVLISTAILTFSFQERESA